MSTFADREDEAVAELANRDDFVDQETGDMGSDMVTYDELSEMYPDKSGHVISHELDKMHAEGEAESRRMAALEEGPRAAAIQGKKTYNTGPKGVRTDYEEAKLKMRARRLEDAEKRRAKVYMKTSSEPSHSLKSFELLEGGGKGKSKSKAKSSSKKKETVTVRLDASSSLFAEDKREREHREAQRAADDLEFDEAEDIDEDVMLAYKMERMRIEEAHRPKFCGLPEINASLFKSEVLQAPTDTTVILVVFQDYIPRCVRFNSCLLEVAKAHAHVKFLKARSDRIALRDYPEIGMPTVIVFKNGDQLLNLIGVQLKIALPFTPKKVEQFLIDKGALVTKAYLPSKPKATEDLDDDDFLEDEKMDAKSRAPKITFASKTMHRSAVGGDDSSSELDID